MGQLTNQFVSQSYQGLLNLENANTGVTSTLQYVTDGIGNKLPMLASTSSMVITGSFRGDGSGLSGITIDSGSLVTTSSFNAFTSSMNAFTSSIDGRVDNLEQETGSLQLQINQKLDTGSFNTYTGSNDAKVNSLIAATGSYATTSSLTTLSGSIATTDLAQNNRLDSIENITGSLQLQINQKLNTGSFNAYTSSNDTKVNDLISKTGSYVTETESGSFVTSVTGTSATITVTKGNGTTNTVTVNNVNNAVSASFATNSISSSLAANAISSSFATNAATASIANDVIVRCKSDAITTLSRGTVVRIVGANGDNPLINIASWENDQNSANTLGMLSEDVAPNGFANVVVQGKVLGVNTNGMAAGSLLYLSSSGQYTTSSVPAPYHEVRLGQVLRDNTNNGSIYLTVDNGYELSELHDVDITTPAVGDVLTYVSGAYGQWVNKNGTELGYANTGSNVFQGTQTISGSLNVTGTVYATSASITYVTSSQIVVSGNTIAVNIAVPAQRFGGLVAYDSGSSNATASLLWDSQKDHWVYENVSGSSYAGAGLMSGPRNTGSLGDEPYPTLNTIIRGQGSDHLYDSNITDDDTVITMKIKTDVSGSLSVTNGITGSLLGNASTATSASHAVQAISSSHSINSDTSISSSFAQSAVSSSFATNAGTAISSSFATNADTAVSSSYAQNADTAVSSSFASTAISSSFAQTSISSSQAQNAVSSSYSDFAVSSSLAQNAISSSFSDFAVSSSQAQNSVTSSYSNYAVSSSQAQNAVTSSFADFAVSSSQAQNAVSASWAPTPDVSYLATTGSNNFFGTENITGSLNVSGSATFREGNYFFDLPFGTQGFNYITASNTGNNNLIFSALNAGTTVSQSLQISGSNNFILGRATTNTNDYVFRIPSGSYNNFVGIPPQFSTSSLAPIPIYRGNVNLGTSPDRYVFSTSSVAGVTPSILNNYIAGTIQLNTSQQYRPASVQNNNINGNLTVITQGAASYSTSGTTNPQIFQNNIQGTLLVTNTGTGSYASLTNNSVNSTNATINNTSTPTAGLLQIQNNTIAGGTQTFNVTGPSTSTLSKLLSNNIIGGITNTHRSTDVSNSGSLYNSIIYGTNLVVSASHPDGVTVATATPFSTVILGSFNETGVLSDASLTKFALGTGTANGSRRTSLYVSSSGQFHVRSGMVQSGSLELVSNSTSGSMNLTGSLNVTGTLQVKGGGLVVSGGQAQFNNEIVFNGGTFFPQAMENFVKLNAASVNTLNIDNFNLNTPASQSLWSSTVDTGSNYTQQRAEVTNGGTTGFVQLRNSGGVTTYTIDVEKTVVTGSIQGNVGGLTISSNTASLNLDNGNFFTLQLVEGTDTRIEPSNIKPGQTINVKLNTTGSATVSFPSSVKQPSGSQYVPTTTTGVDVITLVSFDSSDLYLASVKNLI